MTVHVPAESVKHRRFRFLDWRFLAALAGLVLMVLLVLAAWRNYEIREAETAQKDALIEQLADRSAQIDRLERQVHAMHEQSRADRKTWREERRDARQERAKLIRQQETMLRLLRRYGAPRVIVQRAREPKEPVSSAATSPTSSSISPSSSGGTSTTPARKPTPIPSTRKPDVKATPPTAGKSGKTPKGKAKGLRR